MIKGLLVKVREVDSGYAGVGGDSSLKEVKGKQDQRFPVIRPHIPNLIQDCTKRHHDV